MMKVASKGWIETFLGTSKPLTSLSFWACLLISGLPAALLRYFGVDVDAEGLLAILTSDLDAGERLAAILAILGIRRRLPS